MYLQLAAAISASEASLRMLLQTAVSNNPMIIAADKEYSAKANEVLPSYFPDNPSVGYEYMTTGENKFSINQMLDFPLKTYFKGSIKTHEAMVAKYNAALVKAGTIRDIRIAYFEAAAIERLRELEKNKKMELGLFRDISGSKYKTGRGEQADYVRAKIDILLSEKKVLSFNAERETKLQMLARLIGGPIPAGIEFGTDGLTADIDTGALLRATNSFAGILIKNTALGKSEDENSLAAFDFLPDINLMGTYTTSPMGNSASVFIGLTVPIYLPFKEIPRAAAAGDMKGSAQSELSNAVNEVIADIASRTAVYQQSKETLALFSGTILHEARQALDASFKLYETDKITFFNLLQNIIMLYDYYAEEVMARRDTYTAWAWLNYYTGISGEKK